MLSAKCGAGPLAVPLYLPLDLALPNLQSSHNENCLLPPASREDWPFVFWRFLSPAGPTPGQPGGHVPSRSLQAVQEGDQEDMIWHSGLCSGQCRLEPVGLKWAGVGNLFLSLSSPGSV